MRWLFESLALAGLLVLIAIPVLQWPYLPERAPIHFNAAGEPDRWEGKESLEVLPVTGVILWIGLTASSFAVRYGRFSSKSDTGRRRQIELTRELVALSKAEVMLLFAWLEWKIIQVATGEAEGLGSAAMFVVLGVFGASTVIYLIRIRRSA